MPHLQSLLFGLRKLIRRQFIKGPLAQELGLTKSKRPRRFATKTHLLHFARQLWMADWFEYKVPTTRLDDWYIWIILFPLLGLASALSPAAGQVLVEVYTSS